MSDRSSGQDPDHKPNPANKGEKKQPKPKSVVQEAWTRLKAAAVKLTEADGLELKLGNQFVDALMADSDQVIQTLKASYAALKECISGDLNDDAKLKATTDLTSAINAFDSKMRSVKKAMPSEQNPKPKAKGKAAKK
ncbi:unnamed protein product [Symbiodinium necroappetens]|uniref:Uncharacterized protein n=1 Tax=Symbiodinium necroappetens TaxID=1628268 RepID=A0A812KGP3_9DINO|nr:unnamed protein product [Symbiodinium necroappetens]